MKRRLGGAVGIVGLLTASCAAPELGSVSVPTQAEAYLFRDVSVFDGADLVEHRDVLVSDATIQAVSPVGELSVPARGVEIAGSGRTLLPGLIDSHMHLFSVGQKAGPTPRPGDIAGAFLFAGVTTALVAAGFDEVPAVDVDAGNIVPTFFTAGPGLTAPGGHPIPLLRAMLPWPIRVLATRDVVTAASAEEARVRVREVIRRDQPQFFKVVFDDLPPGSPHLSQDVLQAAVEEAGLHGVRTIVHATTPDDAVAAIDAGASALAHVPQRGVLSDEHVQRIREAGVPVITTVRLVSASHDLAARGPSPLDRLALDDALLDPWLAEPAWNLEGFSEEFDDRQPEIAMITETNLRKLLAAGVPLLLGTDSGVHGVFPGVSLHHEMRLLVELGMPAIEVLRSATSIPAAFLDPAGSFGRIAAGQRADLMLVRGNPVDSIGALSAIEELFVRGVRLQRNPVR